MSSKSAELEIAINRRADHDISPAPSNSDNFSLARFLAQALSHSDYSSLTAFLPFQVDAKTVCELLKLGLVRSVILSNPGGDSAITDPARVGHWNMSTAQLVLPKELGDELLFVGDKGDLFFRLLVAALNAKLTTVVTLPLDSGIPVRDSVGRLLPRYFATSLCSRLYRRMLRIESFLTSRLSMLQRFPAVSSLVNLTAELAFAWRMRRALRIFSEPVLTQQQFSTSRVAFLIGSLGPGGAERQLINTISGCLDHGVDDLWVGCEFLSGSAHDFHLPTISAHRVVVENITAPWNDHDTRHRAIYARVLDRFGSRLSRFEKSLMPYIFALVRVRPKVVHAWLDAVNIKAGLAALIVGVPVIVLSQRSMAPFHFSLYTPYMRPGYRLLAKRKNVILLNNSCAGARDYRQWLGLQEERIRVVPNCVANATGKPNQSEISDYKRHFGVPENAFVLGTIMRFSEEKRPILWVKIANEIAKRRPDVYFVMAGDGPLLQETKQSAEQADCAGRILFTGLTKQPNLALAAMDVFLLTSRLEGLPNVMIEAQSLGVPVVGSDVGGVREALWEGVTGYAISHESPEVFAARILSILEDAEWRANVRRAGPDFVEKRFNMLKMVESTLTVYKTVSCRPA